MAQTILRTAFDSYKLGRQKGEGGSGRVFEATEHSDSKVAIKILDPHKASGDKLLRFRNEIQFGIRNLHRNLISIKDHGLSNESGREAPFYVMPYYDQTLRGLIGAGIPANNVLPMFGQILDGVEAAHLQNVTHRDLKPENVLYASGEGLLVVADFGIARFEEEDLYIAAETKDQQRLANFQYAAPEQRRRGQDVDRRADIYALGLILNEMFTKEVPQGTGYKTIASIVSSLAYLDDLVTHMLRQNAAERPDSIAAVKEQLIGRKNDFILHQRLSELKQTVILETDIDDPLVSHPMALTGVDYRDGQLILSLSHRVNDNWRYAFRNFGGHTALAGKGPDSFILQDNEARVGVRGIDAEKVLELFKQWLPTANRRYADVVRQEKESEIARRKERLRREIEREEERARVLSKLKV